jgi:hypothetical protein
MWKVMLFDLIRLHLMSKPSRIDWLQSKLRKVNTALPSEGNLCRISYLIDFAIELDLSNEAKTATSSIEYSKGLSEFKTQAHDAYNKMAFPLRPQRVSWALTR